LFAHFCPPYGICKIRDARSLHDPLENCKFIMKMHGCSPSLDRERAGAEASMQVE
jgi:hypothetical protein